MIVVAGMFGCKEDFLNKPNYGELTQDIFPQQIDQVELFVNTMYANQHSFGLYGHDIFAKGFYPLAGVWLISHIERGRSISR